MVVSVIVPAFNVERFIGRALDSVLCQTFSALEVLVVDDGSTDKTVLVVESYILRDSRVRLISLSVNSGGPAVPRNVGLDQATGEYVAFLDADDVWERDKLRFQVDYAEAYDADAVCTAYKITDELWQDLGSMQPRSEASYSDLLSANTVGLSTAMISNRIAARYRFRELGHEDYAFWLEICKAGVVIYGLDLCLTVHIRRAGSISADKRKVFFYYWKIYRSVLGMTWWHSFLTILNFGLRRTARFIRNKY